MDKQFWLSVLKRFLRAFVSGAITGMLTVSPLTGLSWREIQMWLVALIMGGITGGLMAIDKALRYQFDDEEV